jgi:hypothetical protein
VDSLVHFLLAGLPIKAYARTDNSTSIIYLYSFAGELQGSWAPYGSVGDIAIFNPIPIPSALRLLGSGLSGSTGFKEEIQELISHRSRRLSNNPKTFDFSPFPYL